MNITNVDLISIPVTNQKKAKDFYKNKLGFKVIADSQFDDERRWIQLSPSENSETTISLVTWIEEMKPGTLHGLVLATSNIKDTHDYLVDNNVDVSPIDETPWGKFIYLKDPDGNGWMIQEKNID